MIRVLTSVEVEAEARSLELLAAPVEPVAPVVLVEPAPAAPVVPVLAEVLPLCCEVVSLAIVLLLELGCEAVSVDEELLLGDVDDSEPLAEPLVPSEPEAEPDVLPLALWLLVSLAMELLLVPVAPVVSEDVELLDGEDEVDAVLLEGCDDEEDVSVDDAPVLGCVDAVELLEGELLSVSLADEDSEPEAEPEVDPLREPLVEAEPVLPVLPYVEPVLVPVWSELVPVLVLPDGLEAEVLPKPELLWPV